VVKGIVSTIIPGKRSNKINKSNNVRGGQQKMERIKRFFKDETATAEATSTVIMIAAVGLLLGVGIALYYQGITGFFTQAGTNFNGAASNWTVPGTGS
jgi:hypothetical protein